MTSTAGIPGTKIAVNPLVFPEEHKKQKDNEVPETSRVLLMTIMNSLYPITTDIIYAISRPCGHVFRIVIIRKRGVQALVEFDSVLSAMRAKASLNGADIYSACCTIKIDYARNSPLIVFRNDTDTWDYTKVLDPVTNQLKQKATEDLSILARIDQAIPPHIRIGNTVPNGEYSRLPSMSDLQQGNWDHATGRSRTKRATTNQKESVSFTFKDYNRYHGQGADSPNRDRDQRDRYDDRGRGGGGGFDNFPPRPSQPYHRDSRDPRDSRDYGRDNNRPREEDRGRTVRKPSARDYDDLKTRYSEKYTGPLGEPLVSDVSLLLPRHLPPPATTSILSMEELQPEEMNCERIFNMVCLFGNVKKIQFEKPGHALVQLNDPMAVDRTIRGLHDKIFFGRQTKLYPLEDSYLPEDIRFVLPDGSESSADFSPSQLNRFNSMQKNRQQYANKTLHYFNAPGAIKLDSINRVCRKYRAPLALRILAFGEKMNNTKPSGSGLIEWDTTSDALTALAVLNHAEVHHVKYNFLLKLCFATPGRDARVVRPGDIVEVRDYGACDRDGNHIPVQRYSRDDDSEEF